MSNKNLEMAKYILSIVKASGCISLSWGSRSFIAIENGLQFIVSGFKHKGYIQVIYNEGEDLFEVKTITIKCKVTNHVTGVYVDDLVKIIDDLVEKTNDYKKSVEKWLPKALSKL